MSLTTEERERVIELHAKDLAIQDQIQKLRAKANDDVAALSTQLVSLRNEIIAIGKKV